MRAIDDLRLLGAGALLCNALPHLANGLSGTPFPTPFARPPGRGLSPAPLNVAWGASNLFAALLLLRHDAAAATLLGLVAGAIGFLALGLPLSIRFGKKQRRGGTARGSSETLEDE